MITISWKDKVNNKELLKRAGTKRRLIYDLKMRHEFPEACDKGRRSEKFGTDWKGRAEGEVEEGEECSGCQV